MSTISKANKKIEQAVTTGYKNIENGVVSGYKSVESGVVGGFRKIEDAFIDSFLAEDRETTEQARERLRKKAEEGESK